MCNVTQCEERVEDYRFRHGGSRVVCSLGLIYSQASGLVLERSGADCSTDAGQVIRPEGGWQLVLQKVPSELHPKVRNHGEGPY